MCTCFAVYNHNNPIYGMNFDSDEIKLELSITNYNDIDVLFYSGFFDDTRIDIAGINSNGLFICNQALEFGKDFKPCCMEDKIHAFEVIMETLPKGKRTSDFLNILRNRNIYYDINPFFPTMGVHTMIVDQYGDGVILEEGTNANVLTRIDGKFIIMTNFPVGDFVNKPFDEVRGCGADRYMEAYKRISNKVDKFEVKDAFDILENTRQDITLCSIVFVPLKQEAYIYFNVDFSKKWKISLKEKTIHSLNGLNNNKSINLTTSGINIKELYRYYK